MRNLLIGFCVVAALSFSADAYAGGIVTSAGVGMTWAEVDLDGVTALSTEEARPTLFATAEWSFNDYLALQARAAATDFGDANLYDLSGALKVSKPLSAFVPYLVVGYGTQNEGFVTDGWRAFATAALGASFDVKNVGVFVESRVNVLEETLTGPDLPFVSTDVESAVGGLYVGVKVKAF